MKRLLQSIQKRLTGQGAFQAILHTSAANLLIMILGTLTSIVTARFFGVEGKGEFSAILFWPTLLAGLVSFGLPTSLIFNMRTNEAQATEYVRAGFLFQAPVSLVVGIVAWFCLPVWLANYPDAVAQIARWYTVLTLPMLLAVNLLAALTQSMGKFNLYNGLRLYVPLSNLVGLLLLWAIGELNLQYASFAFFATSLMVIVWSLYKLRRDLSFNWLKPFSDRMVFKALFGYGGRVFGVELLGTLYSQCDKLIILALLRPRDFGLYTVIYTLSRVFNVVQMAISNVIFPKVTGMDKDKILATVGRAFRLSFLLMCAAVIPGMIIGRFLLGLLFGTQFLEAGDAFYILSLECIVGGGSWILASSFNAMGRPGLVVLRQAIALAVTIGLFFVFTPLYGLNGIAFALLLGAVTRIVITIAAMKLVFKVRIVDILYDKNDLRFLFKRFSRSMSS
ncbi:oligosaccharide flippase family protein [Paenibacillus glycinis]|uniref:Oligosaccharide flippase family protein n=1 Tax=Paenibacillus glycinis TaxID=2697035 RepID=A0ABW9XLV2_9BACL|nr:oligosaccharide flippase family protein [Paenibacillus glycinis]NBD23599.1 oligosaccharide flippase family protein [Paenibacillus glycinis]